MINSVMSAESSSPNTMTAFSAFGAITSAMRNAPGFSSPPRIIAVPITSRVAWGITIACDTRTM